MTARLLPAFSLFFAASFVATAQTTHHTTTHHTRTATAEPALNPADNPPGVPPVHTAPKILYALRYVDMVVGTGDLALPNKFYTVKYTGWLTDGTKFDSSYDHPGQQPITFFQGARRVIPGWDTGFEGMHVGGKRRLYIPYQLAYGEAGRDPIPPKANLIFDLELVSVSDSPTPPPPATPPNTSVPDPSGTSDAPAAH